MVCLLIPAKITMITVDIGIDNHTISNSDIGDNFANFDDFSPKFMPRNKRKIRHILSTIDMYISPTNTAMRDFDNNILIATCWIGDGLDRNRLCCGEDNGFHI